MLNDDATELRRIRDRLRELLLVLPSAEDRNRVMHILAMAAIRAEGGIVRPCRDCGAEYGITAERLERYRRERQTPTTRCIACKGSRRQREAQRDLAID